MGRQTRPRIISAASLWSRTRRGIDVLNITSEENNGQQHQGPDREEVQGLQLVGNLHSAHA